MKLKIVIIGGGGHGRACIDVVETTNEYTIEGIIDIPKKYGSSVLGYPVIASDDDLIGMINPERAFLIGIGQIGLPKRRKILFDLLIEKGANLPCIISPLAYVSKHARIERGTIVMHNAIVNAGAAIGENCIINTSSLIEHDAVIGNHCHVATGAVINGGCTIGESVFIGSNSVMKNGVFVPDNALISAGEFVK